MKVLENIEVPTGNILIVEGDRGKLELLSLGDYGKDVNIKCGALGLDREPSKVIHQQMLPLEKKWVITISTQYGCSMGCNFCDVPKVGPGVNATYHDLIDQVIAGIGLHPEVDYTNRLNIHFARMGEPTWNPDVIKAAIHMWDTFHPHYKVHPVVSTMMPRKNKWLKPFIHAWMNVKNDVYEGNAGLQLSINSTDESERATMFNGSAHTIEGIAEIMNGIDQPKGRKITLNFAVADYTVDPKVLLNHFDPEDYIIKITPMHKTHEAVKHGVKTEGDYTEYYPYAQLEGKLIEAGYDVLVFIASNEEDDSRITCGNAILSGTKPKI